MILLFSRGHVEFKYILNSLNLLKKKKTVIDKNKKSIIHSTMKENE